MSANCKVSCKEAFETEMSFDVSSPGVAPLTWVLGRPASPVPHGTRTRTELTPDSGLSHWWALPQDLPRTPRLGGDRLGFYWGRLGGLGVGINLLWRSHLALSFVDDRSQTATPTTQSPIPIPFYRVLSLRPPPCGSFHGSLRPTLSDETPKLVVVRKVWS